MKGETCLKATILVGGDSHLMHSFGLFILLQELGAFKLFAHEECACFSPITSLCKNEYFNTKHNVTPIYWEYQVFCTQVQCI